MTLRIAVQALVLGHHILDEELTSGGVLYEIGDCIHSDNLAEGWTLLMAYFRDIEVKVRADIRHARQFGSMT